MAQMPKQVENTQVATVWKEIEQIAMNQGVDASQNDVMLHDVSAGFLKSIRELERIQGVTVIRRDEQLDALMVRLSYQGRPGVPIVTGAGGQAIAKPSTVKL